MSRRMRSVAAASSFSFIANTTSVGSSPVATMSNGVVNCPRVPPRVNRLMGRSVATDEVRDVKPETGLLEEAPTAVVSRSDGEASPNCAVVARAGGQGVTCPIQHTSFPVAFQNRICDPLAVQNTGRAWLTA